MNRGRPRGRLVRRLLAGGVAPAVVVLAIFGALAHEVARRSLEDELGKRLATAAAGAAFLLLPEQVEALGAGDEETATYANLRRRLEQAKTALGVRRVLLVAADLTGRGDTAGLVALGAPAHELGADREEIARALAGKPTASTLFVGLDGLAYKRGYAAVGAAGVVVVEAAAEYFASLAGFRRRLIIAGLVGAGLIMLFALVIAARITGPLGRLTAAAERIGRGDLAATVPIETRDEVGRLASRLDEMRMALAARDERLQMMLAGIAHEVRNPLGGLELYAGLLREGLAGQSERLDEVARIERELDYLKMVVTEFLEYARRPPLQPERFAARALLEEVAEVCGKGLAVRIEAPAQLSVVADRGQLRRALINLMRNAVSAAGEGGQLVLGVKATEQGATWEVRDSGPGVPDDLRDKIFTPFFTTREKGTGLGLAFVREIVIDHGGEIAVDTAPEGGARFRFTTASSEAAGTPRGLEKG